MDEMSAELKCREIPDSQNDFLHLAEILFVPYYVYLP